MLISSQREQWQVRSLYFFYYIGVGSFNMFLPVYYRSIGLSGTQIGLVNTLAPFVGMFSAVLWGSLRDRFGKMRLILSTAIVGTMLMALVLSTVQIFLLILPVVAGFALFFSPVISLMDSNTLRMLGDQSDRYGRFRVWGTVGFTVSSLAMGFVYERVGLHTMFAVFTLAMAVMLGIGLGLPNQPVKITRSVRSGMGEIIRNPAWIAFAASTFLLWMAANGAISFVSVKIKDMGGSDSLVGLTWTTIAVLEFPVMFFSAWILRRFGSLRLLIIAFLGYILRVALFGMMPSPAWAPWINILHGASFVPLWIGSVAYVNEMTPEHLKATSQGLLNSMMSLAFLSGSLVSGWLYDEIGSEKLFYVLAGLCGLALVLFFAGRWWVTSKAAKSLMQATPESE
jgi:PPP family 3-phenylpropionic acid transporter